MSAASPEVVQNVMRAAVYYCNDDVRIEEVPKPRPGGGEFIMRAVSSGICGSDVMEWYRIKSAPRVLGHEVTGEIVEFGEGVEDYRVGDRVFVSHHVPCNACRFCLRGDHTACDTLRTTNFDPGGFAEYIRIPRINVATGTFRLPEEVSYDEGVFIEPLACVVRGHRAAAIEPGQSVLVIGSGMSGLLHVQLAMATGAGKIFATDISEYRLRAAERFGARTLPAEGDLPSALRDANDGKLADRVFSCAGAPSAAETAFECAERCGVVQLFAPPDPDHRSSLNLNRLWHEQITISTTYGAAPLDLMQSIELIRMKRVNVEDMITHRLPLHEAGEGFRLVAEADESLKVVIHP